MTNPLSRVLDWLRVGYPDGVPPKDVFPLLALLTRTLHPEELDAVVEAVTRENPDREVSTADIHAAIERLTDVTVTPTELRAVASRLAAAGWPLSDDPDGEGSAAADEPTEPAGETEHTEDAPDPTTSLAQRIAAWLTAGYPAGVPPTDRVPLMALLQRRLSDEDVAEVAAQILDDARTTGLDTTDPAALLARYTDEEPSEADVTRLASRLAAKGWPLRGER
jgi:Protein of unknown function (DUF3349)